MDTVNLKGYIVRTVKGYKERLLDISKKIEAISRDEDLSHAGRSRRIASLKEEATAAHLAARQEISRLAGQSMATLAAALDHGKRVGRQPDWARLSYLGQRFEGLDFTQVWAELKSSFEAADIDRCRAAFDVITARHSEKLGMPQRRALQEVATLFIDPGEAHVQNARRRAQVEKELCRWAFDALDMSRRHVGDAKDIEQSLGTYINLFLKAGDPVVPEPIEARPVAEVLASVDIPDAMAPERRMMDDRPTEQVHSEMNAFLEGLNGKEASSPREGSNTSHYLESALSEANKILEGVKSDS